MNIFKWAENELELVENIYDLSTEHISTVFKTLVGDDRPEWQVSEDADIILRLANNLPLTPLENDENSWAPSGMDEDKTQNFIHKRYSSLDKSIFPDGSVKYRDRSRFIYRSFETGGNEVLGNNLTYIINNDIFPLTLPYYPQLNPTEIYIKQFNHIRLNDRPDTIGLYFARKPNGEETTIEKFFKFSKKKDKWVEISYLEYILRETVAGV